VGEEIRAAQQREGWDDPRTVWAAFGYLGTSCPRVEGDEAVPIIESWGRKVQLQSAIIGPIRFMRLDEYS
jgi:hypothetical protein